MRILMMLLVVLLASCGAAGTPTGNITAVPATEPTAAAPATEATTAPVMETAAPAATATDMIGPTALVMASMVQQLGIDAANLQLVSAEEQEWPNPGLGCPKEGVMYTQVITPGYKITFTDGTTTYEVHTDQTGDRAVLCQDGKPTELTTAGS